MRPITLILTLFLIAVVALFFQKPIPQSLVYHAFADQRAMLGIANFWNVVSNIPFLFIGFYGMKKALNSWNESVTFEIRWLPMLMCFGVFMIGLGSAYYHYAPDNATLVWDRLPMTLVFMTFFALIVYDFCGQKEGRYTFWIALIFGISSIYYWYWTENRGVGDLRPYVLVQFFPMLVLPFLFGFFSKKVNYGRLILKCAGFYLLAKVCEHFDKNIFEASSQVFGGHAIKHFFAAIALYYLVKILDLEKRNA